MALLLILLAASQPAALVASDPVAPSVVEAGADATAVSAETRLSESVAVASVAGASVVTARALIIPKLTPIEIEVLAPLGSKLSKTGEMFPIRLAAPIVVEGAEALPAGTAGMGEVIFAKKSGGMGAAGELVVTARYLEVDGRKLPLRSMHFMDESTTGKSKVDTVNSIAVASAATFAPVAFVGFFIGGGQVNVAEGTLAQAKTAEDFALDTAPENGAEASAAVENSVREPAAASDTTVTTGPDIKEGNGE